MNQLFSFLLARVITRKGITFPVGAKSELELALGKVQCMSHLYYAL
jgi:hypothetical protein